MTTAGNRPERPIFQPLEQRLLLSGTIEGQVWYDLNADRVQDDADPGLDGWTVELVDGETGVVLASVVTAATENTQATTRSWCIRAVRRPAPVTAATTTMAVSGDSTWNDRVASHVSG